MLVVAERIEVAPREVLSIRSHRFSTARLHARCEHLWNQRPKKTPPSACMPSGVRVSHHVRLRWLAWHNHNSTPRLTV
jgi:hypothetical protein